MKWSFAVALLAIALRCMLYYSVVLLTMTAQLRYIFQMCSVLIFLKKAALALLRDSTSIYSKYTLA